jgi:hypothetical protein
MAIQGFFTGDVKIRDLNGVLRAVNGIVEVASDAGTVTSVGLAVGSTGTDVNVANSPITSSGNITLNLPTASVTNRGLLSSADWSTFNSKQGTITLTTTGSSGAATLIGTTLNIPNYSSALTGYVPYTGATANVDLGEYELKAGQLTLDVSPTGTAAVGTTRWNNTIGSSETTLKGGSVILKNGVDLVARVVNKVTPNTTLTKAAYSAVRISGAQGQRLAVAYAQANNDNNSADTIGLVTETIATNQEGFIMTVGQLEGINTTGSLQGETWSDGDVLYLSPSTAGALTNIKPTGATGHIVVMGYVEYSHAINGKIYVKVMNGWELDELHNVYISSVANNQGLFYESSTQLWKNKSIATVLGYTPANVATTITINGTTYDLSANRTWNVGTVTSVGTSGPLTGGTITGSGTIGITQATTSTDGYLSSTDWNTFNSKQAALTFSAPLINTSGTISIPAASASVNGYLSSTDWATFNNKQAALSGTGFVKISGTTISYDNSTYYLASNPSSFITLTALSATAPLSYSNTTGVFSISQATTSTDGYLSSTDWNTFNNKQAAGNYITALTGEATASGPGSASVTLSTSAVTGKLLTGLNLTGGGTIAATDSILQAFGKVQNQISGLAGGVTYQGTWNASTNTPTLTSSVGTKGYYYIVDVAGSTNLNGITDWKIGDWAIFNGSTWDKVDNTDAVSSVNGFTGAVSLTTSNIAEGTNLYYLDSRARLALSFTAGSGAYDNTTGVITIPTNTSQLTNGANFITLSSLSASSPLAYNSGSGAFSIQVATGSQNGYLSSTDWTTFNSKQPAGNYVTTDTTQTITALKTFTAKVVINTGGTDDQIQLVGTAPSVRLTNAATGATINGFVAMSGGANNYIQGSVSGDMTIGNQNNGKILFGFGSGTATQKMSLDSSGNAVLGGGLTLGSTLSNGTYTYTLPGATGTLALISDVQTGYVPYTGATGAVNLGAYDLTVNGVIVGKGAGTGANNVILGDNALSANTTGSRNVAIGTFPLWKNTTGFGSIAIGAEALINQTTGNLNIAIGDNTAKYITTGVGNIAIGAGSGLDNLTTGSYNTILGGSLGSSIGNVSNNIILADGQGNIRFQWDGTNVKLNGNNAITQSGTITTNYLPKFTGTSTIGNSAIFENGTNVGINTASPSSYTNLTTLTINGTNGSVIDLKTGNTLYGEIYSLANELRIDAVGASSVLKFLTNSITRATIDASGNLGLGVTPSAWDTTLSKAIQLNGGSLWGYSTSQINLLQNGFYNTSGDIAYVNTASASAYRQISGVHSWYNAPSGTAGNAISFTQAMTLNASGNLSIGNTNDTYKLDVSGTGIFRGDLTLDSAGSDKKIYFRTSGGSPDTNWSMGNLLTPTGATVVTLAATVIDVFNGAGYGFMVRNTSNAPLLQIAGNTGAATFSSSVTANGLYANAGNSARFYRGLNDYYWSIHNDSNNFLNFGSYAANGTPYGTNPKMILLDNGNVGIGITNPQRILTVYNSNAATLYQTPTSGTGANDGFYVGQVGDVSYVWNYNSFPLAFGTAASERMRITSGGNVGIGTSSPAAIISGSETTLNVKGNVAGAVGSIVARSSGFSNTTSIGIAAFDSINLTGIYVETNSPMAFWTNSAERMRITSGGAVGIGTSSPAKTLTVVNVSEQLRLSYGGSNFTDFRNDSAGGLLINTNAGYIINYIGGTERLRIKTNTINISSIPTSSSGLSSGDIWSDGGTLKIV